MSSNLGRWGWVVVIAMLPLLIGLVVTTGFKLYLSDMGIAASLDMVRATICLVAGLGIVAVALERLGARLAALGVVLLTVFSGALYAFELGDLNFIRATGSSLDYELVAFAVDQAVDAWDVIESETPAWFFPSLFGGLVVLVVAPIGAWFFVGRKREVREQRASAPELVRWFGGGVLLLLLSTIAFTPNTAWVRPALVNIVATGIDSHLFGSSKVEAGELQKVELKRASAMELPHVAFIILESTRATATDLHGADGVTPHLAKLAESSLVARRAQAVVPHTSKALVAIICGFEPYLRMPILEARMGVPGECLPTLLRDHDYRSIFLQSATKQFEDRELLVGQMGYNDFLGLEHMDSEGFEKVNYFGVEDDVMIEPARAWLERQVGPTFTTFLTLAPHHDYLAPRRYGRHNFAVEDEFNRYLNSVHAVDAFVNNVVELYRDLGLYDDTIFVVVGDHGEGFGEHGRFQHDNVIYQEGLQTPLVIHDGRGPRVGTIEPTVSHLDIVPTVAHMAGFIVEGDLVGSNMLELSGERLVPSYCWYDRNCIALVAGRHKYIHHFNRMRDEAFDLKDDPAETEDIIDALDEADEYLAYLEAWRNSVNARYEAFFETQTDAALLTETPEYDIELDVRYENGVTLLGADLEAVEDDLVVRLIFRTTVKLPSGTANGVRAMLPTGGEIGGRPNPGAAWVKTSDWPTGQFVQREFLIPGAAIEGTSVIFTMSEQGRPLAPGGGEDDELVLGTWQGAEGSD